VTPLCQTPGMKIQPLTDSLQHEGEIMFTAAAAGLDASVEACPGWDVARLLGHVGQVYAFIEQIAPSGSTERPTVEPAELPDPAHALEWCRERHSSLITVLRALDADAPAWNWAGTGKAGFFHRRMAHETLIHRWDVETAVGAVTPIDGDLGGDCVDELLHVGLQYSTNPNRTFSYPKGSLHLHRTDGEGEWLARVEGGALIITREHAKGDVAVRGAGGDLALYLWGRPAQNLDVFGDADLADAWANVGP
jgi:uncharacterized protein (TIGR03083 family)